MYNMFSVFTVSIQCSFAKIKVFKLISSDGPERRGYVNTLVWSGSVIATI